MADAETTDNPHGVKASKLCDTGHGQAVHITLEPGEAFKPHITPADVFFYAVEGTGIVGIGDEKHRPTESTRLL